MGAARQVKIYTRGISTRTGRGGYGVLLLCYGHRKELSGAATASSNQMDIVAAIEGLKALKCRCVVTLYNTNTYLIDSMAKCLVERWRARGWINNGKHTPHAELWDELLSLRSHHEVTFAWCRFSQAHLEYARCDQLAHDAISSLASSSSAANSARTGNRELACDSDLNNDSRPRCCSNCGAPMVLVNGWCGSYYHCQICSGLAKQRSSTAPASSAACAKSTSVPAEKSRQKRPVAVSPVAATISSNEGKPLAKDGCWACNGTGYVRPRIQCSTCAAKGRLSKGSSDAYDRYGRQLSDVPGYIYRDDRYGNRKRT
jgi:ribonuclease HI